MNTQKTVSHPSQALMDCLDNEQAYEKALGQFKKFRNDLLEPQEYLYLLKRLQESLLDLQADGLETILSLDANIEKLSQDLALTNSE